MAPALLVYAGYAAMAVAAVAEISSSIAASNAAAAAASAQKQAVKTQTLTQQYKIAKQQNQEAQMVHEQLSQNEMMMAQRGLSTQSPSFNAIQRDTLIKGQQALSEGTTSAEISKLTESAQFKSIHDEEKYKQQSITTGAIGGIAGIAAGGINSYYNLNSPA